MQRGSAPLVVHVSDRKFFGHSRYMESSVSEHPGQCAELCPKFRDWATLVGVKHAALVVLGCHWGVDYEDLVFEIQLVEVLDELLYCCLI